MDGETKGMRRVTLSPQCAWCGKVRVGSRWIPERRAASQPGSTHGICPGCRATYFMDFITPSKHKS